MRRPEASSFFTVVRVRSSNREQGAAVHMFAPRFPRGLHRATLLRNRSLQPHRPFLQLRAAAATAAPAHAANLMGIILTNLLHSHFPLPSPVNRSLYSSSFPFSPPTRLLNRRRSSGRLGRLRQPLQLRLLQFRATFLLLFCGRTTAASAT